MQDFYKDYVTEDLVAQYQSTGDEKMLEEIIRRNTGLIFIIARSYSNLHDYYSLDDLVQEGMIACWKAAQHYKPNGAKFSTVLKIFVQRSYNQIYHHMTTKKRNTGVAPESYEEMVEINKDMPHSEDFTGLEVNEFVNTLTGTTKAVILLLLDGYTNGGIAKELDIKPASVTYHFKRIQAAYTLYREEALA